MEMPEVETYLVEDPDPNGPFGAKEVGQGPLLPMMPAVANAVFDALGVRVDEIPITPEKVLRALAAKDKRYGPDVVPDDPDAARSTRVPTPAEGGTGPREPSTRPPREGSGHDAPADVPLPRARPRSPRRRSCSRARAPAPPWSPAAPTSTRT